MSTTATAYLVAEDGTLYTARAEIAADGSIALALDAVPNGSYNLSLVVFGVAVGDATK